MRRLALLALLLAAARSAGAPAPFPKVARPDRVPSKAQLAEKGRVLAALVRPGMAEPQVIGILGDPGGIAAGTSFFKYYYSDLGITVTFTNGVVKEVQRHSQQ
jgi:hypothetical protein